MTSFWHKQTDSKSIGWLIFSGLLFSDLRLHGDDIYFSLEDEQEDNTQHQVCYPFPVSSLFLLLLDKNFVLTLHGFFVLISLVMCFFYATVSCLISDDLNYFCCYKHLCHMFIVYLWYGNCYIMFSSRRKWAPKFELKISRAWVVVGTWDAWPHLPFHPNQLS